MKMSSVIVEKSVSCYTSNFGQKYIAIYTQKKHVGNLKAAYLILALVVRRPISDRI